MASPSTTLFMPPCANGFAKCRAAHVSAVAVATHMSDRTTDDIYTYSQVANSMPCNTAEQLMPRRSYAAI
eukprot:6307804-Alexandrium_andersonii.AAC.1